MSTAQFTHVGMRSIAGFEFLHLRLVYDLGLRKQLKEAVRLSGRLLCAELARRGSESLKVHRTCGLFCFIAYLWGRGNGFKLHNLLPICTLLVQLVELVLGRVRGSESLKVRRTCDLFCFDSSLLNLTNDFIDKVSLFFNYDL